VAEAIVAVAAEVVAAAVAEVTVAVVETAMAVTTAEAVLDQASEMGTEAETKTPVPAAAQAASQKATEAKHEVNPTNLRTTLAKALARVKPIAATSHQKAASKADVLTDFRTYSSSAIAAGGEKIP